VKAPLVNGGMNEHHRRLMAALAPKPIEGVDNWGIPDEPTTPCDPDRAVSGIYFTKEEKLIVFVGKNSTFSIIESLRPSIK
jgi:hypothetical protein